MAGVISSLVRGLLSPLRALGFLMMRPRLWPLAAMPALLTGAALVALGSVTTRNYDAIRRLLLPESLTRPPTAPGLSGLAQQILQEISAMLVGLGVTAAVLVASILIGKVLAAPFNDALSARAEVAYTGLHRGDDRFSVWSALRSGFWAIGWELRKAIFYVCVMVPMFALAWIPGVGPVVYLGLTFTFNVVFMAFDYLDFPLERRPGPQGQLGMRERFTIVWRHRWPFVGYGITTSGLLFVPGLNVFFVPLAVCGATLLYIDVAEGGPPSPGATDAPDPAAAPEPAPSDAQGLTPQGERT